jgi:hypothetical protein
MATESLAAIADKLPNGFHDAELNSIAVDWGACIATVTGEAWVAEDGPPEVYRPFRLTLSGLQKLVLPDRAELQDLGARWERAFADSPSLDGMVGWPPDREPASSAASTEVPAYSFFVFSWNEFITVEAERAELIWLGPSYQRR